MLIEEISMKAFRQGLRKTKTLIVPYGTVEAHGTHLPLSTDTMIMQEVARRAGEMVHAFVAPPVHYGVCTSTGQHPGTIAITPETLRRITIDIVRDSYKKGLRNFVLISGHGGSLHVSAMKEAAESLAGELKSASIAALSIYEALPPGAERVAETRGDSHAGELETSLILFLAGGLVKGRAKEESPNLPKPIIVRNKQKYWPGAVWGNPEKASLEKGEKLFSVMVESLAALVRRLERFKD